MEVGDAGAVADSGPKKQRVVPDAVTVNLRGGNKSSPAANQNRNFQSVNVVDSLQGVKPGMPAQQGVNPSANDKLKPVAFALNSSRIQFSWSPLGEMNAESADYLRIAPAGASPGAEASDLVLHAGDVCVLRAGAGCGKTMTVLALLGELYQKEFEAQKSDALKRAINRAGGAGAAGAARSTLNFKISATIHNIIQ
jgi:hypothetical protein